MQDVFSQMFPMLSGISLDLGTILLALLGLGFLMIGFDLVKVMLFGQYERNRYFRASKYYYDEAKTARSMRDMFQEGTIEWEEQNLLYKNSIRKSVDMRIKGRSQGGLNADRIK